MPSIDDVEDPLPDLTRPVVLVDEVEPDLDVRPVGDGEVPRHLGIVARIPTLGGEHARRRRGRDGAVLRAVRAPVGGVAAAVAERVVDVRVARPIRTAIVRGDRRPPGVHAIRGTAWPRPSTASAAGCRAFPGASSRPRPGASSRPRAGTCRSGCGSHDPDARCRAPPRARWRWRGTRTRRPRGPGSGSSDTACRSADRALRSPSRETAPAAATSPTMSLLSQRMCPPT